MCGSRAWKDAETIRRRLAELPRGTTIIHGGARGADRIAGEIAAGLGFEVAVVPAEWRPGGVYNPRAGYERNAKMLDMEPDLVLAFWIGGSTGTAHTISAAHKRGIPVEVIP